VTRRRDNRGSAAPFAVACLGLLVLLAAALGVVAAMIHAHRQAQSAADLAALAAAGAVGRADPCQVAAAAATTNGATLTSCDVAGREVRVNVVVEGPAWLGQEADLTAEARAGPG
jgi:secretion/DNA translocation related TadE-like protein